MNDIKEKVLFYIGASTVIVIITIAFGLMFSCPSYIEIKPKEEKSVSEKLVEDAEKSTEKTKETKKSTYNLTDIQTKLSDRYSDITITNYNSDNTGTFTSNDNYYNFDIEDDLLKVVNLNDKNDISYYKLNK